MYRRQHKQCRWFRSLQLLLWAVILPGSLISVAQGDIGRGVSRGGFVQAHGGGEQPDTFTEETDSAHLPPLLIIKVQYTDGAEQFAVESYGLGRGIVRRPGSNPRHRYLYQAVSPSGQVLAEGTFDTALRPGEIDPLSDAPDDVIHLPAERRLLIRIPYRPEIRWLRVLTPLSVSGLKAIRARAARGEVVPPVVLTARTGQPAIQLSSLVVDAAAAQPIVEEVWFSGGVRFRPGQGMSVGPTDLVGLLQGRVEGNFRLNADLPRASQTEPFIAINPLDPDNLVAGANETERMGFYSTTDGGDRWRVGRMALPSRFSFSSDPGLAADAEGTFYYSFISFNLGSSGPTDNGVFVARSMNGGRRFRLPVTVIQHLRETNPDFEDKPFIAADANPRSPFANNVYVSWTSFQTNGRVAIKFSRSTDGGRSFSEPLTLRQASSQQNSLPLVGPDGEVYLVWQLGGTYRVARSTDGGATFERDRRATSFFQIGTFDPSRGRRILNGGFRVASYPAVAADTGDGPRRGHLYLVWADGRNGDADILFVRSTDGGQTWSFPPLRINDDAPGNGKDQFFPWISVDPTNGNIVVMFYDRRNDPENLLLDVYLTRSTDGGETFEPNFQVNTESFDPTNDPSLGGRFIGDYNGLVTYGNIAYPVWADTRRGELDIFGARVNFGLQDERLVIRNQTSMGH